MFDSRASEHPTPAEVAILDLCAHVVIDPEKIPAEAWDRVEEHYDDGHIVEIVAAIGAYLQVSKFGDSLGVELDPSGTATNRCCSTQSPRHQRRRSTI